VSRADWLKRAREALGHGERNCKGRKGGTCGALLQAAWIFIFLIIWTQLFHCKYYFSLPKFMIFFSLQIETWII